MEIEILDNFAAVSFLANGNGFYRKPILLMAVSWEEYECFLTEFAEKAGWRLAYDEGNLEIMPPLAEHEEPAISIDLFVRAYGDYFELVIEQLGSTTYRRELKKKGVEPDACFYVRNADKIIGKAKLLKPETYPAPDVAVEIDVTHGSLNKFKIYAALGVPELWLYDGENVSFYQLAGEKYNQIAVSIALPRLAATTLTEFIHLSEASGQTVALKEFRRRLGEQK